MWNMYKESECKGVNYCPNNNKVAPVKTTPEIGTPQAKYQQGSLSIVMVTIILCKVNEAMQTIVEYSDDFGM
jgi:hypothetical protein